MRTLTILLTIAGLVMVSPALADTTVTITTNNVTCQVPPPVEVPAPATPSVAAGVQAARNKDFALARANFSPLAANGDAEAERAMGQLLMQDCTGLQDKDAGANWLSKAADVGNIQAAAELGNAYMTGRGVAEDDNKAIPLLQKAADAGVKEAQTNLGYLYTNGRGVPMDKYQGMVWTVKGGEQGAPAALLNIAWAYFKGGALPQDNDKAAYYMYAALERSTGAQRSRFAGTTNDISRALSAADLARASRKALSWSPGSGSLSDVLDDAKRTQARTAKN